MDRTYAYAEMTARAATGVDLTLVDCWEPATRPGLVIHREIGAEPGWAVSQLASGLKVGYGALPTFAAAEAFLVDLLPIADWAAHWADLRKTPGLADAVKAACTRHDLDTQRRHTCHPDRPGSNECVACLITDTHRAGDAS